MAKEKQIYAVARRYKTIEQKIIYLDKIKWFYNNWEIEKKIKKLQKYLSLQK